MDKVLDPVDVLLCTYLNPLLLLDCQGKHLYDKCIQVEKAKLFTATPSAESRVIN